MSGRYKGAGARRSSSSSSSSSSSDDEGKKKRGIFKKDKESKDIHKISKSELRQFQRETLETHNDYRKKHKVQSLKMSDDLCKSAQKWAKHLAKHDKFETSNTPNVGENVAMRYSSATTEYSGKQVSDQWYAELRNYDFKKPVFRKGTGNFTQMVWKGSREFGIGKAITKEGKVILVAHYQPPGNVVGQYEENVFPRSDGYVPPEPQTSKVYKSDKDIGAGARRGSTSSSSSSSSSDDEGKKKRGLFKKDKKDSKDIPKISRSELKTFRKDALETHNEFRKKHKVESLKMSDDLCKSAQKWAKHLAKRDKLESSNTPNVGENVASRYSTATTEYSGKDVSEQWYADLRNYNFKKPEIRKGTGNFTQMVWKGSKEFGIGKAITKEGKVILVAHYRPPGNFVGECEKNVFPRSDGYVPPEPQTTKVTRTTHYSDDKKVEVTARKIDAVRLDDPDLFPKDLRKYRKDLLEEQNKLRKKHDAKPLKQSKDLDERAQKWAAYLAKEGQFRNSDERDLGENIAMSYNSATTEFSGAQAAEMWYKQKEKYNFRKPGFTSGAGHFTQMVWKDSKEFGAGKAVTKEGKVILVGFYNPPGNVNSKKQFEDNVEKD